MTLTESARKEISALNQIFVDEFTTVEDEDKLELHIDITSSRFEDEEIGNDDEGETPSFKLVVVINGDYPNSPPDIRIEDSNLTQEREQSIIHDLNQIIDDSRGEEVLFSLINYSKEILCGDHVDVAGNQEEDQNEATREQDTLAVTPVNPETFDKWKKSLLQEAVDMLEKFEREGYSTYDSYWKLPQYMRSMAYICNIVPEYVLLSSDLGGKPLTTGKKFMLLQKNAGEDEMDESASGLPEINGTPQDTLPCGDIE